MKRMIIASTSTIFGQSFLEYLLPELRLLFANCDLLVFIPYARPGGISYEKYTDQVKKAMREFEIEVKGIHEFKDPKKALELADAVFVGGGNTFVLLDELYKQDLLATLREAVLEGIPYLGTSAGSNITGPSIMTTNDMPIVRPPSFRALNLIPYNINPHFLDPDPDSKHKGETRETRIKEFHAYNHEPVLGLREGSWIEIKDQQMKLGGKLSSRMFKQDTLPYEIDPGTELLSTH